MKDGEKDGVESRRKMDTGLEEEEVGARERGEGGGKKKVGSGCKTRRRIVEGRGERKRAIKQTRRTETEM